MLGKLAAAWIGDKVAGRNEGAKGAILGYGAASVAERIIPTLAVAALVGWGAKKLYDRFSAREPSYPSDASPSSS